MNPPFNNRGSLRNCSTMPPITRMRDSVARQTALFERIIKAERDQKADQARIDAAIAKAEQQIAVLVRRPITREQLHKAIIAVRDRTVLAICNVRRNMQTRTVEAKNIEESLSDEFLRQKSTFAEDEVEDVRLRMRFFKLMECTPTFTLIVYLRDALKRVASLVPKAFDSSYRVAMTCLITLPLTDRLYTKALTRTPLRCASGWQTLVTQRRRSMRE
jgi:hypothetical protein